eukprot:9369161-Karenia_brevis.AAC.1
MDIQLQIGSSLGVPHRHECSIPQGCPFSMTLVALLTLPWIKMIRANNVVPRTLADDLYMQASGPSHGTRIIKACLLYTSDAADDM